jgi:hypothetical protein
MYKFRYIAASSAFVMLLSGCGGDSFKGSGSSGGGTGGTGNNGGTTYSLGSGSGSAFTTGALALSSTTLSAGGTATITANVVDATGALYAGAPVTVQFVSSCLGSGGAKITPSGTSTAGSSANSVTSSTGTISATYTATGCASQDTITGSTTVSGQSLIATGTLTVQPGTIGSIQFDSATPTSIGLKGTGVQETSTVVFVVVDSTGAPRPGATVKFSLPTNVGSMSLTPASAVTGADGKVQTVVSAGTQHTSVRVTATIDQPALSTQSSALTVTTGVPSSETFSISVGSADYGGIALVTDPAPACSNVEAANLNQVRVPVTVSLADRFRTPVPDQTAVTFATNAGKVIGSCTTGVTGTSKSPPGECVVTWSSEDPRPSINDTPPAKINRRGHIFATAIGEEAFEDANGNGFYETGEHFDDLGEPYRDDNENGAYAPGEYFIDFNSNHLRDGPSGAFKGIVCTGDPAAPTCTSTPLSIGVDHVIIMSTSGAQISVASIGTNGTLDTVQHTINYPAGQAFTMGINIQDLSGTLNATTGLLENGNPIPAGSKITVAGTATLTLKPGDKQGCSENINGDNYLVSGTAPIAGSTATITVVVEAEASHTFSQAVFTIKGI